MRIDSSHCGMVCKFTVTQDLELSDFGIFIFSLEIDDQLNRPLVRTSAIAHATTNLKKRISIEWISLARACRLPSNAPNLTAIVCLHVNNTEQHLTSILNCALWSIILVTARAINYPLLSYIQQDKEGTLTVQATSFLIGVGIKKNSIFWKAHKLRTGCHTERSI